MAAGAAHLALDADGQLVEELGVGRNAVQLAAVDGHVAPHDGEKHLAQRQQADVGEGGAQQLCERVLGGSRHELQQDSLGRLQCPLVHLQPAF